MRFQLQEQTYGDDPLAKWESALYREEFVEGFVEKWDESIGWDARAKSKGCDLEPLTKAW